MSNNQTMEISSMTEIAKNAGLSIEQEWEHRRKLAILCRILGLQGHIGLFGHVSLRIPNTDIVLITPGAGSEKTAVRADQIFVFDLDGTIHHHPGGDRPITIPLEWRIHTRVHRDRPEVGCVAHLHAHCSTLLGIAQKDIVPVYSRGALFCEGIPTWDNPRLVVDDEMAGSLSKMLNNRIACQMRGHGSVVVGATPETTLVACTYMEENARFQIEATRLGAPKVLSADEIADCGKGILGIAQRLWDYWERQVVVAGEPL
jgi:ribulose-5-phosphate 4-epimerase/fuculose-1-phosphate aldolase